MFLQFSRAIGTFADTPAIEPAKQSGIAAVFVSLSSSSRPTGRERDREP
jgi:hypothetical protein